MATSAEAKVTTDHEEIQQWAEERGAEPSCVRGTGNTSDIGMLRLDFPGYSGEDSLEHISWDEWFEKFDERGLALLHQETTASGEKSNFNKLVSRETAEQKQPAKRATSRPKAKKTAAKKSSSSGPGKKASKSSIHHGASQKRSAATGSTKKSKQKKTGTKLLAGKKATKKKSSR